MSRNNRENHLTMGITHSNSAKEKRTRQTPQKKNVRRLPKNQQTTTRSNQGRRWKRMYFTHTTPKNRRTVHKAERLQSFLEFGSGYYHIGLKDSAKPKSAFLLSSLGKYQFNRVPFGLAQAPAYFQKLINDVLKGCNFAMGYLDDIIIYSRSEKEHLEHLEEIITRLKSAGLKLKLEKCCFFRKTHTIPRTLNFGRRNPTTTRKTRKHCQNAST